MSTTSTNIRAIQPPLGEIYGIEVIENQVIEINGQYFDGFKIRISNHPELNGTYPFTHEFRAESGLQEILSGAVWPRES